MSALRAAPVLWVALAGCGPPGEASWLDGFGYSWQYFNHRVSHVSYHLEGDAAWVAVVGGTSTTGSVPDLDDTCDPDACQEFPFVDRSQVDLGWHHIRSPGVRAGTGRVHLVAGPAGQTETVDILLDGPPRGEVVAFLRGFTLDTDVPLAGGDGCYDPAFGWMPRRIALEVGEPVVEGHAVRVAVTGVFEAGNSLEEVRECIDEVVPDARAAFEVEVQVLAGRLTAEASVLTHGAATELGCAQAPCFDPLEQPEPDGPERALPFQADAYAWRGFDYRFHVDDPEDRGGYLRDLSLRVDPAAGLASGHATNFSPGTQLSGFDYTFEGALLGLSVPGEVEAGRASGTLETLLDEAGLPQPERLPL